MPVRASTPVGFCSSAFEYSDIAFVHDVLASLSAFARSES